MRLFARAAVLATTLAGCGGSTPTLSADQACTEAATASCAKRASCTNGASIVRLYGDMNTCLARVKLACVTGLGAPNTGNSPTLAEQCSKTYAATSCDDFLEGNFSGACAPMGKIPSGSPCAFGGQCQTGFCATPFGAACGTCANPPMVGDSCATYGCRQLACGSNSMTCAAYGAVGAMCDRDNPCAIHVVCMGLTAMTKGTCVAAAAAVGAMCDFRSMTAPNCDATNGLSCATSTKSCVNETFAAAGQPCALLPDGSFGSCAGDGLCVRAMGAKTGACVAPAPDGAACDTVNGPPCLTPSRCITGGNGATTGICGLSDPTTCK